MLVTIALVMAAILATFNILLAILFIKASDHRTESWEWVAATIWLVRSITLIALVPNALFT